MYLRKANVVVGWKAAWLNHGTDHIIMHLWFGALRRSFDHLNFGRQTLTAVSKDPCIDLVRPTKCLSLGKGTSVSQLFAALFAFVHLNTFQTHRLNRVLPIKLFLSLNVSQLMKNRLPRHAIRFRLLVYFRKSMSVSKSFSISNHREEDDDSEIDAESDFEDDFTDIFNDVPLSAGDVSHIFYFSTPLSAKRRPCSRCGKR